MENPQTIGYNKENGCVETIDQRYLPFQNLTVQLKTLADARFAISDMIVRGAPLIGVTAAYGMYLAALNFLGVDFIAEMKHVVYRDWETI